MQAYLTFIHALSPLHAGTGQGSGVIDLPIAREKATGLPYLPGSSLKGTLRSHCPETLEPPDVQKKISRVQIFGNESADAVNASAGTIQISDQHVLLFPVRSLAGTFAWVTSPYILRRLKRDLADLVPDAPVLAVPEIKNTGSALVVNTSGNNACQLFAWKSKIYLEDLDLSAQEDERVGAWADWLSKGIFRDVSEWQAELYARLCVIHDDAMNFLLETATEIVARIRLDESSKTVSTGALWYEEALPTETILRGLGAITPRGAARNGQAELDASAIADALKHLTRRPLSLGGKSTVGHGLCRVSIYEENS